MGFQAAAGLSEFPLIDSFIPQLFTAGLRGPGPAQDSGRQKQTQHTRILVIPIHSVGGDNRQGEYLKK